MEGASYVSTAVNNVPKAGKAAGTEDSKITMKGTFAENKDSVATCRGQAAALMAECQPASAKVKSAAVLPNRFSPLIKGSSGRYGPRVASPGGPPVVATSGNAGKESTKAVPSRRCRQSSGRSHSTMTVQYRLLARGRSRRRSLAQIRAHSLAQERGKARHTGITATSRCSARTACARSTWVPFRCC